MPFGQERWNLKLAGCHVDETDKDKPIGCKRSLLAGDLVWFVILFYHSTIHRSEGEGFGISFDFISGCRRRREYSSGVCSTGGVVFA